MFYTALVSAKLINILKEMPGDVVPKSPMYSTMNEESLYAAIQHKETLSWAVKLRVDENEKDTNYGADIVAAYIGLRNLGQIGALTGHYFFVHPSHGSNSLPSRNATTELNLKMNSDLQRIPKRLDGWKDTFLRLLGLNHYDDLVYNNDLKELHPVVLNNDSADHRGLKWDQIREEVDQYLESHPDVVWYTQQYAKRRSQRSAVPKRRSQRSAVPRRLVKPSAKPINNSSVRLNVKRSTKTRDLNPLKFNDPMFAKQWHLVCYINR